MTNATETEGHVRVTDGTTSIEFALWVLIKDGLHAPPFDKHPAKNGILQQYGMDASNWNQWLKLIAIGSDDRLSYHVENIEEEARKRVESSRNSLKRSFTNDDDFFDELWYSSREREHRNQLQKQEQTYTEAIADYPGLDASAIHKTLAPQLWEGNQESQTIINQMWDEYQLINRSNPHIVKYLTDITPPRVQSFMEMGNYVSGFRKIHLLAYEEEIELFIPPVNIIITVKDAPINVQSIEQRMLNAVRFLSANEQ